MPEVTGSMLQPGRAPLRAAQPDAPAAGPAPAVRLAVYLDADEPSVALGRPILETAGFEVVRYPEYDGPAGLDGLDAARLPGAVAGATALLVSAAPVPRILLESVPTLAIVSMQAVGTNNVDLVAAGELGVWVCNVPAAATGEVATHALTLALALVRHLSYYEAQARKGVWALEDVELPRRPSELTLGVVGLGRIGRRLAELAAPVFGRLVGHDPLIAEAAWPASVEQAPLDALLATSDVVSLHLPLTPQTRHLIGPDRLRAMKRGAYLVNVSRGDLVDLPPLLEALDTGRLAGAALDVFPREPPDPADPVLHHPKLLVTPHVAYLSRESAAEYARTQAQNVAAWAATGRPDHVVVAPTHPRT